MKKGQLELFKKREKENDRNHHKGGRSFYFFDFDDNVLFLKTKIYLFHKETKEQIPITTSEFTLLHKEIGKKGHFKHYKLNENDEDGSFRRFRDPKHKVKKLPFEEDILEVLTDNDLEWKGPSWHCFYHAVFNKRPISIITARGHSPKTIEKGIKVLVKKKHLPHEPNILSIFPVSHLETRQKLGDKDLNWDIATLKKEAIRQSVNSAIDTYGNNPYHRFGMSDDDPKNIELIEKEMKHLKKKFPSMSFFVIRTDGSQYLKTEVLQDKVVTENIALQDQLFLFD